MQAMLETAAIDGLTVSELELFALEAVQCTRRAGFEMTLESFDRVTGETVFSVASGSVEEGPAEAAAEGCMETYFSTAYQEFQRSGGASLAEATEERERRERAILECLEDAGFDFSDAFVALSSDSVPEDVRQECSLVYFG